MPHGFQGKWELCGNDNLHFFLDKLPIPDHFKNAIEHAHISEDIHINGDSVHLKIGVAEHTIPSCTRLIEFEFGKEFTRQPSFAFGKTAKGTGTKLSDTKWQGKYHFDQGDLTLTREIVNGEMWVTMETSKGLKAIRKFERDCSHKHEHDDPSPFNGRWRLYGSENFDKFLHGLGVPCQFACFLLNIQIEEDIHVKGNHVTIKIVMPSITVPYHTHEIYWTFGVEHDLTLPFGHTCRAKGQRLSDTKWRAELTGGPWGHSTLTRERIGDHMVVTFDCGDQHQIVRRKFQRKH